jgi:hypothetical protein
MLKIIYIIIKENNMNTKIKTFFLINTILFSHNLLSSEFMIKLAGKNNIVVEPSTQNVIPDNNNPPVSVYSSCNDILLNNAAASTGVHTVYNGSKEYDVYCDMNSFSGGWTLVAQQYESDPVTNWNEGIQPDYNPASTSIG